MFVIIRNGDPGSDLVSEGLKDHQGLPGPRPLPTAEDAVLCVVVVVGGLDLL